METRVKWRTDVPCMQMVVTLLFHFGCNNSILLIILYKLTWIKNHLSAVPMATS